MSLSGSHCSHLIGGIDNSLQLLQVFGLLINASLLEVKVTPQSTQTHSRITTDLKTLLVELSLLPLWRSKAKLDQSLQESIPPFGRQVVLYTPLQVAQILPDRQGPNFVLISQVEPTGIRAGVLAIRRVFLDLTEA